MEGMDEGLTDFLRIFESINTKDSKKSVKLSAEDLDSEFKRTELDVKREDLEGQRQDRDQRKKFANKIFWMLIGFLGATMSITSLTAIDVLCFSLSDTVLVTLLATTTANVIAIFLLVVRYLFKANMCPKCGVKITSKNEITTNL